MRRFNSSPALFRVDSHKILSGGEHRCPGVQKQPELIGGSTINDAVLFHLRGMVAYVDIEKLANDDITFAILRLSHYQLRHCTLSWMKRSCGRLMITLTGFKRILKRPIFLSIFLKNKSLYYDNLMRVRTHDDINQWFKFSCRYNRDGKSGWQRLTELCKFIID